MYPQKHRETKQPLPHECLGHSLNRFRSFWRPESSAFDAFLCAHLTIVLFFLFSSFCFTFFFYFFCYSFAKLDWKSSSLRRVVSREGERKSFLKLFWSVLNLEATFPAITLERSGEAVLLLKEGVSPGWRIMRRTQRADGEWREGVTLACAAPRRRTSSSDDMYSCSQIFSLSIVKISRSSRCTLCIPSLRKRPTRNKNNTNFTCDSRRKNGEF